MSCESDLYAELIIRTWNHNLLKEVAGELDNLIDIINYAKDNDHQHTTKTIYLHISKPNSRDYEHEDDYINDDELYEEQCIALNNLDNDNLYAITYSDDNEFYYDSNGQLDSDDPRIIYILQNPDITVSSIPYYIQPAHIQVDILNTEQPYESEIESPYESENEEMELEDFNIPDLI